MRLHPLLEALPVVRVLGSVGEAGGAGVLAHGVVGIVGCPVQAWGLAIPQAVRGITGTGRESGVTPVVLVGELACCLATCCAGRGSGTRRCLGVVVRRGAAAVGVELSIAAGVGEAGGRAGVVARRAGVAVVGVEDGAGGWAVLVGADVVVTIGGVLRGEGGG